jgi:hypothetical protein
MEEGKIALSARIEKKEAAFRSLLFSPPPTGS